MLVLIKEEDILVFWLLEDLKVEFLNLLIEGRLGKIRKWFARWRYRKNWFSYITPKSNVVYALITAKEKQKVFIDLMIMVRHGRR